MYILKSTFYTFEAVRLHDFHGPAIEEHPAVSMAPMLATSMQAECTGLTGLNIHLQTYQIPQHME